MRRLAVIALIGLSLSFTAGSANAIGCLSGGAVGAVGGHYVGKGHAVLGAAAGCYVGHKMAKKQADEKRQAAAQHQAAVQGQGS